MNQQPSEQEKFYKAQNEKLEREKKATETGGKFIFCGLPLLCLAIFLGLVLLSAMLRH